MCFQTGCRFVAANLYAKSVSATLAASPLFCTADCMQVFGEDALLNISVEREASGETGEPFWVSCQFVAVLLVKASLRYV